MRDPAISELLTALRRLPILDGPGELHDAAEQRARELGWDTRREVWLALEPGRGGRIDLVCTREGARGRVKVAIELDRGSPRAKSLRKLRAFWSAHERVILLRRRAEPYREGDVLVLGTGEP